MQGVMSTVTVCSLASEPTLKSVDRVLAGPWSPFWREFRSPVTTKQQDLDIFDVLTSQAVGRSEPILRQVTYQKALIYCREVSFPTVDESDS